MNVLTPRRKPPKRPRAGEQPCDCGCGVPEYFNKMRVLDIEIARDETLRQTQIMRRYFVRSSCYEDFIRELQAKKLLEGLLRSYFPQPWWRRALKMRRVVKMQFVINVRLKGLDATRRLSLRSGIMFAAPRWLGKMLDQYWQWSNRNNLVWRWSPAQFKTPKPTSTNIIDITDRPSPGCLPSPSPDSTTPTLLVLP